MEGKEEKLSEKFIKNKMPYGIGHGGLMMRHDIEVLIEIVKLETWLEGYTHEDSEEFPGKEELIEDLNKSLNSIAQREGIK